MPKKQYTIALAGYTSKGILANTHQADQVVLFKNESNTIHANVDFTNHINIVTVENIYQLNKSSYNKRIFKGELANGIKAHFTKKKLVAKLIYWA